ncbi:PEGA domain-containing protein [Candidatus Gottesmanbacteria bacterium]|nr:PEGA domain-containing protein [Candidatus Gottesmanbacteria bacterium]
MATAKKAKPTDIFNMVAKIRSFLIPFVTICIILAVAAGVIAYGRGYRFDFSRGSLKATGLLVVHSDPTGAQILLDGKLNSATAATLNLLPGWYTVTVSKEGFQSWSQRVKVQGEVVAHADALLIPSNPSLTAITASGVANPVLSPDGTKLAYVIPVPSGIQTNGTVLTTTPGIWVLDVVDKPLGLNRDARQITKSTAVDFSKATLQWSPDSKQIFATIGSKTTSVSYLLDTDKLNDSLVATQDIKTLQSQWADLATQRDKEKLATLPLDLVKVATTSMGFRSFSPDETKILYEATASATIPTIMNPPLIGSNPTQEQRTLERGAVYIYDITEDKNFVIKVPFSLAASQLLQWLPTSRQLLLVGKDKIEILDYDGTNQRTAYSGPFWDSFAVPWASGGKIVILTNLNPSASTINNLYAVNLR